MHTSLHLRELKAEQSSKKYEHILEITSALDCNHLSNTLTMLFFELGVQMSGNPPKYSYFLYHSTIKLYDNF